MTSQITTLTPVAPVLSARTLVTKAGFTCSLLTLAPGDEILCRAPGDLEEHFLFVVEGQITVRLGEVNTMLGREEALLIAQRQEHRLSTRSGDGAKVLRIAVPPRSSPAPAIVAFDS